MLRRALPRPGARPAIGQSSPAARGEVCGAGPPGALRQLLAHLLAVCGLTYRAPSPRTVAYRNKTFVSFASEDITCYRLMCAWGANAHIDFNFHNAHDLNVALDTSRPETIRRRLRERLANTKQVILLLGDHTRSVASRPSRFLYYEVEVIRRLDLPVVFANLNGSRESQAWRMPRAMERDLTLSVSFQPKIIKYALDHWTPNYGHAKRTKTGPRFYKPHVYEDLGL